MGDGGDVLPIAAAMAPTVEPTLELICDTPELSADTPAASFMGSPSGRMGGGARDAAPAGSSPVGLAGRGWAGFAGPSKNSSNSSYDLVLAACRWRVPPASPPAPMEMDAKGIFDWDGGGAGLVGAAADAGLEAERAPVM
jgi:hypothetical protein